MSLRVRATLSQEAYYLGGEVQFRLRFALDDDADAGGDTALGECQLGGRLLQRLPPGAAVLLLDLRHSE